MWIISESHYKYQIKKWGLKRSTSKAKKEAIYRVVKSRAQNGKSSVIRNKGRDFDAKNFARYVKSQADTNISLQPNRSATQEELGWLFANLSCICGPRM